MTEENGSASPHPQAKAIGAGNGITWLVAQQTAPRKRPARERTAFDYMRRLIDCGFVTSEQAARICNVSVSLMGAHLRTAHACGYAERRQVDEGFAYRVLTIGPSEWAAHDRRSQAIADLEKQARETLA